MWHRQTFVSRWKSGPHGTLPLHCHFLETFHFWISRWPAKTVAGTAASWCHHLGSTTLRHRRQTSLKPFHFLNSGLCKSQINTNTRRSVQGNHSRKWDAMQIRSVHCPSVSAWSIRESGIESCRTGSSPIKFKEVQLFTFCANIHSKLICRPISRKMRFK